MSVLSTINRLWIRSRQDFIVKSALADKRAAFVDVFGAVHEGGTRKREEPMKRFHHTAAFVEWAVAKFIRNNTPPPPEYAQSGSVWLNRQFQHIGGFRP